MCRIARDNIRATESDRRLIDHYFFYHGGFGKIVGHIFFGIFFHGLVCHYRVEPLTGERYILPYRLKEPGRPLIFVSLVIDVLLAKIFAFCQRSSPNYPGVLQTTKRQRKRAKKSRMFS